MHRSSGDYCLIEVTTAGQRYSIFCYNVYFIIFFEITLYNSDTHNVRTLKSL